MKVIKGFCIVLFGLMGLGAIVDIFDGTEGDYDSTPTTFVTGRTWRTATTEPPEPEIDEEELRAEVFLSLARPIFSDSSDSELLGMARDVCDAIDQYGSVSDFMAVFVVASQGQGIDGRTAGEFIGLSVGYECPEYGDELENL